MNEISKIKLLDGHVVEIKDEALRWMIETLLGKTEEETTTQDLNE